MSQVACATPNERCPRRKGGSARQRQPGQPPPSAYAEAHMVHLKSRLLRAVALLAAIPLIVALALAHGASANAQFPVTIKAANGTVTIPHRPTRIVSLSPASTQDLFAVGAGKQVVA